MHDGVQLFEVLVFGVEDGFEVMVLLFVNIGHT